LHRVAQAAFWSCYLANAGQDTRAIQLYLGHKNTQHTVRYTELAAGRFKDFWKGLTNRILPSDGGSRGRLEITTLTMRPQFAASNRSSRGNELRSNYQSLSSRFIAGTWKTLYLKTGFELRLKTSGVAANPIHENENSG
jgi:hypothetical protein